MPQYPSQCREGGIEFLVVKMMGDCGEESKIDTLIAKTKLAAITEYGRASVKFCAVASELYRIAVKPDVFCRWRRKRPEISGTGTEVEQCGGRSCREVRLQQVENLAAAGRLLNKVIDKRKSGDLVCDFGEHESVRWI